MRCPLGIYRLGPVHRKTHSPFRQSKHHPQPQPTPHLIAPRWRHRLKHHTPHKMVYHPTTHRHQSASGKTTPTHLPADFSVLRRLLSNLTSNPLIQHHYQSLLALSVAGLGAHDSAYLQQDQGSLNARSWIGICNLIPDTRPANVHSATTNLAPHRHWNRICEHIPGTSRSNAENRAVATKRRRLPSSQCTHAPSILARNL